MNVKKVIIMVLLAFFLSSINTLGQELMKIESQLDSLLTIKSKLELYLDSVNKKINELEIVKLKIQTDNDIAKGTFVELINDGIMRTKPSAVGDVMKHLPKKTKVLVIGYTSGYYKIKVASDIGYINEMFLPENKVHSKKAESEKSSSSLTTNHSKSTTTTYTKSKSTRSQSRTIHTGPRGGKYYINSKGNKVYIKKKKK